MSWLIAFLCVVLFIGWRIYRAGPQALVRTHRQLANRYAPPPYSKTEIIKHRAWQRLAEQRKRESAKRKRNSAKKKREPKLLGDALLSDE